MPPFAYKLLPYLPSIGGLEVIRWDKGGGWKVLEHNKIVKNMPTMSHYVQVFFKVTINT